MLIKETFFKEKVQKALRKYLKTKFIGHLRNLYECISSVYAILFTFHEILPAPYLRQYFILIPL